MKKCESCIKKKGHWVFGLLKGDGKTGLALVDYTKQTDIVQGRLNPEKCFVLVDKLNEIQKRPDDDCPFFIEMN